MKVVFDILIALMIVVIFSLLMAFPTMWLWNGLMPQIFGLKAITFAQALGLNVLSGIFFRSAGNTK